MRGGKEASLVDTAWRYRSVAALISVPARPAPLLPSLTAHHSRAAQLLLIATVALLMPRAPLPFDGAGASGPQRYAVVVDAGSTGSRVHAFAFTSAGRLVSDTFEQLKPGLSSYATTPAKGADSLRPLLDKAVAAVPAAAQAATPVVVRATAGLRLLPGQQAEDLLAGARAHRSRPPRPLPSQPDARRAPPSGAQAAGRVPLLAWAGGGVGALGSG